MAERVGLKDNLLHVKSLICIKINQEIRWRAASSSLVIDTNAARGKIHVTVPQHIFWCSFEALVAIALLQGGGLAALKTMAVSTGLPFTLVLLGACRAIVTGLIAEKRKNARKLLQASDGRAFARPFPLCLRLRAAYPTSQRSRLRESAPREHPARSAPGEA